MGDYDAKPDRLEKIVRFVCGALAGGIAGLWAAVGTEWTIRETVGIIAAGALVFGGCAVFLGDRFWRALLGRSGSW